MSQVFKHERSYSVVDVWPLALIPTSSTRQVALPPGPTSLIKWSRLMKLVGLTGLNILCGLGKVFLFLTEHSGFETGV